MSGTTGGGWPQPPNLGALYGMANGGQAGGVNNAVANGWGAAPAATPDASGMTPQQLTQMRQRMYAQALMGQGSSAPQRSGWGAVNNAMAPLVGAAMARYATPQAQPTQVSASTPNLAWNPNNPVGTSTLGGATANQGSWLGNLASRYFG